MLELVFDRKLLNEKIWILCIISCSLAIVSSVICALFCFIQLFPTFDKENIAKGTLIWNGLSGIFILLSLLLFAFQFNYYIQNNILTQEELDNGWISTNLAELSFSFYILFIPFILILLNVALISAAIRLKRSFVDLKNEYDNIQKSNSEATCRDLNLIQCRNNNVNLLKNERIQEFYDTKIQASYFTFNLTGLRSSSRLKKIIDLIY